MDYLVIGAENTNLVETIQSLEQQVKNFMSNGYELQGGVALIKEKRSGKTWYIACQALVKQE